MSIQTENVFNCLKAVIRWSDLRWDSKKVLDIVKENGVFVLTRSDIELLKQFIPDLKNVRIRGYLGVMPQDDKKLPQFQLMLLSSCGMTQDDKKLPQFQLMLLSNGSS